MSGFRLHPEAFTDLDDIRDYIAQENPDAADRIMSEVSEAIGRLVPFPFQGHRRTDLTSRPLRFILVREYLIALRQTRSLYGLSRCCTDGAAHALWRRYLETGNDHPVPFTLGRS
jgi:plasmid stabilization system protein ParE